MTGTGNPQTIPAVLEAATGGARLELVRGQEQSFLERMTPIVRRQSVILDLASVERIDAAGLSALITLYSAARRQGHSFAVTRPGRHVREVLSLVGLESLMLAHADAPSETACRHVAA